jgi:hypothetical protein
MLAIATLASCRPPAVPLDTPREQSGVIIPVAANGIELFAPISEEESGYLDDVELTPRVDIPEQYISHGYFDLVLDFDAPEEQIIAFKFRDGQDDRIGLLLADYDPLRDGYFISWQGLTMATSLKTFVLYTEDITGDRQQEIVFIGTNNSGEQTLDIFKQAQSNAYGLQYRSIISIEADIEAIINVVERNEFYNNGERNGAAYTISSVNQDLESENPLDMVRSVYTWRPGEGRYLLSYTENIPGSQVEEDQLAELSSGNADDYLRFISGPWIKEGSDQLLYISQITSSVQLAFAENQQSYLIMENWISSRNGWRMSMNLRNENLSHVRPRLTITVRDLNSLEMSITRPGIRAGVDFDFTMNEIWGGVYTRLLNTEGLNAPEVMSSRENKVLYPYGVNGLYRSDNNWEMFFSAPLITFRTQDEERSGGYAIYRINEQTILEINYLRPGGAAPEKQQFLLEFDETRDGNELRRTIFLQEADLSTYGAIPVTQEVIRLEQTIELEDAEVGG